MQKPFRFESKEMAELAKKMYQFESLRVSGPGSARRKLTEVLWSEDEFRSHLGADFDDVTFSRMIQKMVSENQMMKVPENGKYSERYISRTGETLRLLGHNYEYWHRGRSGIDAVRWEVTDKKIPRRHLSSDELIQNLEHEVVNKLQDKNESDYLLNAIKKTINGISSHFIGKGIDDPKFSTFQKNSIRDFLLSSYGLGNIGNVIVADVGAGKTLAFLLGPIILVNRDLEVGESRSHLFLYPRKALAVDQYTQSLVPFATACGVPPALIHSEMRGNYNALHKTVNKGIEEIYGHNPPRLVLSSLETMKNRISNPIIMKKLVMNLKSITLDEIHLNSGVQGAQVAMLVRRVRLLSGNNPILVGASATIATPKNHFSRLTGIMEEEIGVVSPISEEMVPDGVVHHAFLRPSGLISGAGVLANSTSLFIHSRRDEIGKRPGPKTSEKVPKMLGFADNLEILGSWNDDFRENERADEFDIGQGKTRRHPGEIDLFEWEREQREIPYAMRYVDPLQRRIDAIGGIHPDTKEHVFEPVIQEYRGKNLCKRCKSGERIELGTFDQNVFLELSKLVHRSPSKEEDLVKPFMIRNNEVFMNSGEIGTMDLCPYLQAGACIWFSRDDVGQTRKLGKSEKFQKYDYASIASSSIQSAKSEDNSEATDLTNAVFRREASDLYNLSGSSGDDFVDVVFASPSLEVGIDLPNVTESIMTRAVRNLASYRQKAGRVGRESMSDGMNVTVTTNSSNDIHFYRQPRKLIETGILEPVPLKERNLAVIKSTAYMSIWDYLVKNSSVPEVFYRSFSFSGLDNAILECVEFISKKHHVLQIKKHISNVVGKEFFPPETDWFTTVVNQVKAELEFLLRDTSGMNFADEKGSRSLIAGFQTLRNKPASGTTESQLDSLLEEIDELMDKLREQRNSAAWMREFDEKFANKLDKFLMSNKLDSNTITDLTDDARISLELTERKSEERKTLKKIIRTVEDILELVEELEEKSVDYHVYMALIQYRNLVLEEKEESWKTYFLSTSIRTLRAFSWLREDDWFVSPEALYIHPYIKYVILDDHTSNEKMMLREDQKRIPINEALHSLLPGMWTKRFPQGTYKALAGLTSQYSLTTLSSQINHLEKLGYVLETVAKELPAPPGMSGKITILSPLKIPVRAVNKRVFSKDKISISYLDGDEGSAKGREVKKERVPKSFGQRWIDVELHKGIEITPYLEKNSFVSVMKDTPSGSKIISESALIHPLKSAAFKGISWHENVPVTEYTYSVSRTTSMKSELIYQNKRGSFRAFGSKINTEGIEFKFDKDVMDDLIADLTRDLLDGDKDSMPTMFNTIRAFVKEKNTNDDTKVSEFELDDFEEFFVRIMFEDKALQASVEEIFSRLNEVSVNQNLIGKIVNEMIKSRLQYDEIGKEITEQDELELESRIKRSLESINRVLGFIKFRQKEFEDFISDWIYRTVKMTFGVIATKSLQRISGAESYEVGFAIPNSSWMNEEQNIFLFDKAESGNGNVSVARKFMHIPSISRQTVSSSKSYLPSEDFITLLEESLLPCKQKLSDLLALHYLESDGVDTKLHSSISDLSEYSREIYGIGVDVWKELGIEGSADAWKLPLLSNITANISEEKMIEYDDVFRATNICWNGCPECVERIDLVQGGLLGLDYVDKYVLDRWFKKAMELSNSYQNVKLNDFANENAGRLSFGEVQSFFLERDNNLPRIRSVNLPWNVGIDIITEEGSEIDVELIVRTSDIIDETINKNDSEVALGLPSSSFKRLLWFDLLMTAYLDMRGLYDEIGKEKEIKIVYYDARDISFSDVGISPQMFASLTSQAREDGILDITNLSDMINWLAKRGFKIDLCIDKSTYQRESNAAVRNFIGKFIKEKSSENIRVYTREVKDNDGKSRSMHKKTVLTPNFALKGTSNMTNSGSGLNEEDVDHVFSGNLHYDNIRKSIQDTITQANILE